MAEDRMDEMKTSDNETVMVENDIISAENVQKEAVLSDLEGNYFEQETVPEENSDGLRKNTKTALIVGAVLGLVIGVLMFLVPNRVIEEGARLVICVILILLGPRLMADKYHIDFTKGRYTMAGGLALVLIIYILIGHPIN